MDCTSTRLSYRDTGAFSKITIDYAEQADALKSFYAWAPDINGLTAAIAARKEKTVDRKALVASLRQQYNGLSVSAATENNIQLLEKDSTFTITTAHQPNLFTGPLYFLYKILHAIKLSEHCKTLFPQYDFVPVYYMGNEDADLDELGHFYIGGEKKTWQTKQTGAVGWMKVDKQLLSLLDSVSGELAVETYGEELVTLLKDCYREGVRIQDATLKLVNSLFGAYGLVVLIPDTAGLKKLMTSVFREDLLRQTASGIVSETAKNLEASGYKIQAYPREINLFYLVDGVRNRITQKGDVFYVVDTDVSFSKEEMLKELDEYPGRFSPNVILRGLYQETILPNLVFIGGGGETAYWLQLQDLFKHYNVPFPVLVLRNSFLILDRKSQSRMEKLGFSIPAVFQPASSLLNELVKRNTEQKVHLNGTFAKTSQLYEEVRQQAGAIDVTLEKHVEALKTQTLYRLQELEKKMLRAEKKKFSDQSRQIDSLKQLLFPNGGLQERIDNFMPYYAKWGKEFIEQLYRFSPGLEQEFVVLSVTA